MPENSEARSAFSIKDCVVRLKHSYRFRSDGGIGALARAIQSGSETLTQAALTASDKEVSFVPHSGDGFGAVLGEWVLRHYSRYLESTDPEAALEAFESARVLCAHRRGPFGAERVNELIEAELARAELISPKGYWYSGRPILVTQNDYSLQLFNGDVGIVRGQKDVAEHPLRVFFAARGGPLRAMTPARLPSHETAFAMSIHKSQGSEFDEVAVVLPDASSPLLSRELLYTAVTRARRRVVIFGPLESVMACVRQPVRRASGLSEALLR